jgi:hypothetical protein
MFRQVKLRKMLLLAGLLASSIAISAALTQSAQGRENAVETPPAPVSPTPSPGPSPAPPPSIAAAVRSARGEMFVRRRWGVDNLQVRETSSGWLVRFSYRVVDASKAKQLYDKKATAYLIDKKTGLALQVPMMEKIGELRQTTSHPVNGQEYWMVFSNKGHFVKPGSRVDVVIGRFRVEGLVVEDLRRSSP